MTDDAIGRMDGVGIMCAVSCSIKDLASEHGELSRMPTLSQGSTSCE